MWGIGFLWIVGIYLCLIVAIGIKIPPKLQLKFGVVMFFLPISFPFWYLLSPRYYQFQSLYLSA